MKISDILKANRTEEIRKLNKGLLKSWQCRCKETEEGCRWRVVIFGDSWCGVSPLIDFKCPMRKPQGEAI